MLISRPPNGASCSWWVSTKASKEIADILCRSVRTIEFHRARICEKLKLKGGDALVVEFTVEHRSLLSGRGVNPTRPYLYLQQLVGLPVGIP